jgi:hypothetical protein
MEDAGKFWKNIDGTRRKDIEYAGNFHGREGKFRRILRRFGFIIIVTRRRIRTSINRRATPPKVGRFQLRISLPSNLEPRTLNLEP